MAYLHNLIGQRFGTLTAIRRTKNERGNQARFVCLCDCGKEHVRYASSLFAGKYEGCDCESISAEFETTKPAEADQTAAVQSSQAGFSREEQSVADSKDDKPETGAAAEAVSEQSAANPPSEEGAKAEISNGEADATEVVSEQVTAGPSPEGDTVPTEETNEPAAEVAAQVDAAHESE